MLAPGELLLLPVTPVPAPGEGNNLVPTVPCAETATDLRPLSPRDTIPDGVPQLSPPGPEEPSFLLILLRALGALHS